jgi:hypothetical protein
MNYNVRGRLLKCNIKHVKNMKFIYKYQIAHSMIGGKVKEIVFGAIKDKKVLCLNLNRIEKFIFMN